jgi:hypothetical protein
VAEVIVARGLASIHLEKYSTATTTYFKLPYAGGSGFSKSRPTFAVVKWAVLVRLKMKVVSGLWHMYGNFHIFEPSLLHSELPSANKILV